MSRLLFLGVLLLYVQNSITESSKENTETNDDNIFILDDKNFNKVVMESDDVWLVQFHAPWCFHCKILAPKWKKAAIELKGKVKFGSYDVTTNTIKTREHRIEYYPTIKFFPFGLKDYETVSEYLGETTTEDIVDWVTEELSEPNSSEKSSTSDDEVEKRVKKDTPKPKLFIPKHSCLKESKAPNDEL